MDLDLAYLEAAMPDPVVLLHQDLRPYSLGHEMLLRRHGSPFVTHARAPELADVYTGVFICYHLFEVANAELAKMAVNSREFDANLVAWQELVVKANGGPVSDAQELELVSEFHRYVSEGSKAPRFRPIYSGGLRTKPGAPFLALILRTLTSVYHFTQSEALNTPYGWAQWLYLVQAEQDRRARIVTPDDDDVRTAVLAEMKKRGLEPIIVKEPPPAKEEA